MTTLLSPVKLQRLRELVACTVKASYGPMAEVGVYRGGSALAMLEAAAEAHCPRTIYLFDTFEGLPHEPGPRDAPGASRRGQFAGNLAEVIELLSPRWANHVEVQLGTFPESATGLEERRWSVVHVDVDLEESVRACCEWFPPRMQRGGVMVFDDYGSRDWRGVKPAVDERFGERVQHVGDCHQAWVEF